MKKENHKLITTLLKDNGYGKFLQENYHHREYWNILIFLSGLLDDATEMVRFLEENGAVELAAYCVREGKVKKEIIDKVVNDLIELVRMELKCKTSLPWLRDVVFAVKEHVEIREDWEINLKLRIAEYICSARELQKILKRHKEPTIAMAIARVLGEIGGREGIEVLKKILKKYKKVPYVAWAVAEALGKIGEKKYVKILKKIFKVHRNDI